MFLSCLFGSRARTLSIQSWYIKSMKKSKPIKIKKQTFPNGTQTKWCPQCLRYVVVVFVGFSLSFFVLYVNHTDGLLRYPVTWRERWFVPPHLQKAVPCYGSFGYQSTSWRCCFLHQCETRQACSPSHSQLGTASAPGWWGKYLEKYLPTFDCTLVPSFYPFLVPTGITGGVEWKQQIWITVKGTFFRIELYLSTRAFLYVNAFQLCK